MTLARKRLSLPRICSRNIYLNLFGGAHFHWRSLKACNIAKKTCLNYVWTVIFPWSFCSLKLQILRLFRARSSKTMCCRFTLKRQKQPPEMFFEKAFLEISQDRQFIKVGFSTSKKMRYMLHWKPSKNDEEYFSFHLKNSFHSQYI